MATLEFMLVTERARPKPGEIKIADLEKELMLAKRALEQLCDPPNEDPRLNKKGGTRNIAWSDPALHCGEVTPLCPMGSAESCRMAGV